MRVLSKEAQGNKRRLILEIIAAISVAAIIAAILFPVFAQTGGPRKNPCLSILKQLTTSVLMYTDDNNECLPPYYTFDGAEATQKLIDVTMVYSKNTEVYFCPQDDHSNHPNQEGLPGKMSYVHSLALRGVIPTFSTGSRVLKVTNVKNPAETALLRDPIRGYGLPEPTNSQPPQDGKSHFFSPHGERFILTYLDGHSRARTPIDEFNEL